MNNQPIGSTVNFTIVNNVKALSGNSKHTPTSETMLYLLGDYRKAYLKKRCLSKDSTFNRLDEHNAIVRAVNSNEELLRELKHARQMLIEQGTRLNRIDEAIAKAEGIEA